MATPYCSVDASTRLVFSLVTYCVSYMALDSHLAKFINIFPVQGMPTALVEIQSQIQLHPQSDDCHSEWCKAGEI
jgi:hypothetical protein